MNRFGPGLKGALWFNFYWSLFAVICLLIAGALWNRGSKDSLINRIKTAKKEVPKSYRGLIIGTAIAWIGVAGFVFYNTQVLNPYRTSDTNEQLALSYEKTYGKYRDVASPKVMGTKYYIDIFPNERNVHVKAEMEVMNATDKPLDSIHVYFPEDWKSELSIPNAEEVFEDDTYLFKIYKLTPALQPGERTQFKFDSKYITKGFENGRGSTSIIKNGTFFNNGSILPVMGYNEGYEINNRNTRRKYDLPEKERMPKLTPGVTKLHMGNYLSGEQGDFINVETFISTVENQIAIAPGSLQKQWNENGRNYYHYKVDTPSLNFYSFISADYEIAKRKWNGVDIEIYHDKKHTVNIDMMLDAVERSLEYYTKNFGPYYHKQARIIEFPRYANFAQAFPGTMP